MPGVDGGESSKLNSPRELRLSGIDGPLTFRSGVRSGRAGLGPFGCRGFWILERLWSIASFELRWLDLFRAATRCLLSRHHRTRIGTSMARSAIGTTMAAIAPGLSPLRVVDAAGLWVDAAVAEV